MYILSMDHAGSDVGGTSAPCRFVRACALIGARHGRFVRTMVDSSFFGLWPVARFLQDGKVLCR